MEPPEGKKFYGSVTVSERGQIVIPAEARQDFNIKPGDKILVLGDIKQGIAIVPYKFMQKIMQGTMDFFREAGMLEDGDKSTADEKKGKNKENDKTS